MCVAINIKFYCYFDSYGNAVNSSLSVIVATILILFPFFIGLFYTKKSVYNLIE